MTQKIAPLLLWLAVLVIALTIGLALCSGAPVPKPKELIRPEISGSYTMRWCGTDYDTQFFVSGEYWCVTGNSNNPYTRWVGNWQLKGDEITITERLENTSTGYQGHWTTYKFTLEKGKLESKYKRFCLTKVR